MNSSNPLVEASVFILHRRKLHACALGSLELVTRSTRLQSGYPALPCPSCLIYQSGVTQLFTSASRKYRAFPLYIPFLPSAPQKKRKDLSASPDPGEDTVGEGDRWAGLNLWLPVYSLYKYPLHEVPRHPPASTGSFWVWNFRKEGSSALTMPPGVMCWLAASQQMPRRALSCPQAGTHSCLALTA